MYGDLSFREPARQEVMAYANAGAPVYSLYFDMELIKNTLTFGESCCGFAHAAELIYTFGGTSGDPTLLWDQAVSDYIVDQVASIVRTGENGYKKSTFI